MGINLLANMLDLAEIISVTRDSPPPSQGRLTRGRIPGRHLPITPDAYSGDNTVSYNHRVFKDNRCCLMLHYSLPFFFLFARSNV